MKAVTRLAGVVGILALLMLGLFSAITVAQGDVTVGIIPDVTDPSTAMLAGVTGLALVITVIMNLLRNPIPADVFDRWAPTIAAVVGIVFALLGVFAGAGPKDFNAILQALLVGLFAGGASQNLNTIGTRALARGGG